MGEEIAGGVVPLNLCVMYRFSYQTFLSSMQYFFGDISIELDKGELPGTGLKLHEEFKFGENEEAFRHLQVLLTYLHEQFHLRHLTASPLGFLLYLLGGRQYAYIASYLRNWGSEIGNLQDYRPHIPLLYREADNTHMVDIAMTQKIVKTATPIEKRP